MNRRVATLMAVLAFAVAPAVAHAEEGLAHKGLAQAGLDPRLREEMP